VRHGDARCPCPVPECGVSCPARGAQRRARRPPALPLSRVRGLLRRDPRHVPVPAEQSAGGDRPAAVRGPEARAAEELTGHEYETSGRRLKLAARPAAALEAALVYDLSLTAVEVDEFYEPRTPSMSLGRTDHLRNRPQ